MNLEKLNIISYGNPKLKKISEKIKTFNKSLKDKSDIMYKLMNKANGVGLAAVQVGILEQIIVIDIQNKSNKDIEKFKKGRINLINPEIIKYSEDTEEDLEGCLSIPGVVAPVNRAKSIYLKAYNLEGNSMNFEATGLLSRVIQHEIDHLNGILFIERLSKKEYKKIKNKLNSLFNIN